MHKYVNSLFAMLLVMLIGISPLHAQPISIVKFNDIAISVPVPDGYVAREKEEDAPDNYAIFGKEKPGAWEEEGEVSDNILVYAIGFRPSSEAIKQQKFEAIVDLFEAKINDTIKRKPMAAKDADGALESTTQPLISPSLINGIFRRSYGTGAYSVKRSSNRPDRKAVFFNTKKVMPGVFTFPMIEEISFVRVKDVMVIVHASGLDTDKLNRKKPSQQNVQKKLKAAGAQIRDGLVAANKPAR